MTTDLSSLFEGPAPGPRTMHEHVHSTLRRAILDGHLEGGTRLVQSEIASTLGVSTTPVREALRDLAAEGLIQLDPHRGGTVRELDLGELDEIFRLRSILEPEALRRAWPHITNELIDKIETLHHQVESTTSSSEFVQLNDQFHGLVYEECDSPRLLAILQSLTAPWVMYVGAALNHDDTNRQRAAVGHAEILSALRNRDLDAAITATIDHLSITQRTLESSFQAEAI